MKKEEFVKPGEYNFYEYLKKSQIYTDKEIFKKVHESSIEDLFIISTNCYLLTLNLENNSITDNFFDFAANETLSGGSYPCSFLPHRIQAIKDVVSFSFLYSDSISLINPFEFMYSYIKGDKTITGKHDEEYLRNKVLEALIIMKELEKSISLKKIYFAKLNYTACKKCLKKIETLERKTSNELFDFASKAVAQKMIKDIDLIFQSPNEIIVKGLNKYFSEEDVIMTFRKVPKEYKKYLRYKKVSLPKSEVETYVKDLLLNNAVDTVMMHYGPISMGNRRTFLTNNQVEAEILNYLRNRNKKTQFTPNLLIGLNHLAPFIRGAKLEKVIKFRQRQEKEFENYRKSIKQVLKETENSKSQEEFEKALRDIVKPNLDKLENVFRKKQEEILDTNIKGGLTCLISISLGIVTKSINLLNEGLIAGAIASIGCFKKQYELEQSQKSNNFYFLWKLNRLLS